ncbi:hypothetical protein JCM11754A_26130 [Isoptericola variabilis]
MVDPDVAGSDRWEFDAETLVRYCTAVQYRPTSMSSVSGARNPLGAGDPSSTVPFRAGGNDPASRFRVCHLGRTSRAASWPPPTTPGVAMDEKLKLAGILLGGYLLGRTKKLRTAVLLSAAVAGNRLRDESARGALFDSLGGLRDFASSPEIKRLTSDVTGRLVDAGKVAAVAAVTSRVDDLTSRLEAGGRGAKDDEPADESDEVDDEPPEDEAAPEEDQPDEADDQSEDQPAEAEDDAGEGADDSADEPAEDSEEQPEKKTPARRKSSTSGRGATSKSSSSGSGSTRSRTASGGRSSSGTSRTSSRSGSSGAKSSASKSSGSRSSGSKSSGSRTSGSKSSGSRSSRTSS